MRERRIAPFVFSIALLAACQDSAPVTADQASDVTASAGSELSDDSADLCVSGVAKMRCFAKVRLDTSQRIFYSSKPSGLGAADLQAAYQIPATGGDNVTIAIVDAFDYPNAEADLAKYRKQYKLPPCTSANGCFKKVNQRGTTDTFPKADSGWAGEAALDLDMASAACPQCKLLLVVADSADTDPLGEAVNTAVRLGATVVSNSYGGDEDDTIATVDEKYFHHPGVGIFASSGDSGFVMSYPASGAFVIAVGGTSLRRDTSPRGFSETVWDGAGSGCSKFVAKPGWQTDTGCALRTVADVSAVADPYTGVATYFTFDGQGGWSVTGGTSVASPLVAGIFAHTGHGADDASFVYAHAADFNDVTRGTNGTCKTYLCQGTVGYDGPTGVGSPIGTALAKP